MNLKKLVALTLVAVVIANMILFGLSRIPGTVFWAVIAFAAVMAYFVIPKIK